MPKYQGPFDGHRLNSQPIEKRERDTSGYKVEVHSMFYTIQGEGPFCGFPAVFVRLAGCNLQCPLCDTEYTERRALRTLNGLLADVSAFPIKDGGLVVITGGEPFRQNIGPLIDTLVEAGFMVQVETNGTLPPPELKIAEWRMYVNHERLSGAYIVCSPKTGKVNPDTAARACCYKYVARAGEIDDMDGLPLSALAHTANPKLARPPAGRDGRWTRPVYLQPADERDEGRAKLNMDAVRESAMRYGYILQLQIHKFLGVE